MPVGPSDRRVFLGGKDRSITMLDLLNGNRCVNGAQEVADHIYSSLLDLNRRIDSQAVIEVARAIARGAAKAIEEMEDMRLNAGKLGLSSEIGVNRITNH